MSKVDLSVLSLSFIFVVAILYSALIMGALWANNRVNPKARWSVRILRFFAGAFLLTTGLFAMDGTFLDFGGMPPKIFLAIVPGFVAMLYFAFHPLVRMWVRETPQRWLIGLQTFRIAIEIQLYYLAMTPMLPKLMTFEGRNFDILVGLSAPLIAWLVHRAHVQGKNARGLVTAWNIFGLILLTNVVIHGILSSPVPFRQIFVEPPNTALATFPYIWLPTFVVPFAYLLHILSLRKEWARDAVAAQKAREASEVVPSMG